MQNRPRKDRTECGIEDVFEVLGGRWKAVLIWHLSEEPMRFKDVQNIIPTISRKMLTQQLRRLEEDGLIKRKSYAEAPPRVEYWLTPMGQDLKPLLKLIYDWTTANLHTFKRLQRSQDSDPHR